MITPSFLLRTAQVIAGASKDPNTKVGALLVDTNQNIRAVGYNGFPRRVNEYNERWVRPAKYLYTIHAEANALFAAARNGTCVEDCEAYVTMPPCMACAGALIQAGIRGIYYPTGSELTLSTQYLDTLPLVVQMCDEAGVEIGDVEWGL